LRTADRKKRAGASEIAVELGGRDPLFGTASKGPRIVQLRLELVQTNPNQPRKTIEPESLRELAASIERHGLLQPVTVQRLSQGDEYLLVAGERRFRAFQLLGREAIPAILAAGDPDELALIENLQREELKPLEEAAAIARLMELHGYTQEQLAKVLGKHQSAVSMTLRLNDLPEAIKADYETSHKLPKSVLLEIARVKDPDAQRTLWQQVRTGTRSTVRAARAQRSTRNERHGPTSAMRVIAAGRSFLSQLAELPPEEFVTNRDQCRALQEIKRHFDVLYAEFAAAGAHAPEEELDAHFTA
jgi:ParB family chromosome partitioning protein